MESNNYVFRRIRLTLLVFIIGLVLSGLTAIPIEWQLDQLTHHLGLDGQPISQYAETSWQHWLLQVRQGVAEMNQKYPFLSYGGDWLAFGHLAIAVVFLWALRDPIKNRFLFDYGLVICMLVIPYALILGHFRGVPLWWRGIDSLFGIIGGIPLLVCRVLIRRLKNPDLGAQDIR